MSPSAKTKTAPPPHRDRLAAEGASAEDLPQNGQQALDARAALLLPAQLLQPGELIVLVLKPSPLMVVLAPLKQLTVIVLLATLGATIAHQLGHHETASRILLAGLAIVTGRVFWECLEWLGRVYVLTDQRVIRVGGVLRVSVFEAGLQQVQHSEVYLSLRERLFNLGTIGFNTAGTAMTEAYWQMVANPLEVHRTVVNVLRRYRK